jgi:hypothetical protein
MTHNSHAQWHFNRIEKYIKHSRSMIDEETKKGRRKNDTVDVNE